jgi:hypothetical protein
MDQRLLLHKFIYPLWAEDNKHLIFFCAALGLVGGVGSAVLLHYQNQFGLYVLPVGLAGVLGYGKFYLQELYDRYVACGWDMYF